MGKYDPLRDYLRRQRSDEFEMTFADIERRLGAMLPKGANRPQWWAGDDGTPSSQVQRQAWSGAGFDATLVLGKDRVRFIRIPTTPDRPAAPSVSIGSN